MSPLPPSTDRREPAAPGNRFDRMEWAGAFGDLGTLIPFVVAYIAVLKIDPFGILFTFGAAMIVCGLYYKTPFPVQPMKAIGAVATTQAAQTASVGVSTSKFVRKEGDVIRHNMGWTFILLAYLILVAIGFYFLHPAVMTVR